MELKTIFNLKDDCWLLENTTVKKGKVCNIEVRINSFSIEEYVKTDFGGPWLYTGKGTYVNQAFKKEEEMITELTRRINGGNVPK